jgi:hypothetical protein
MKTNNNYYEELLFKQKWELEYLYKKIEELNLIKNQNNETNLWLILEKIDKMIWSIK